MIWLMLVVIGLCLGSFVNALVWRLHAQAAITDKVGQGKKLTKADRKRLQGLSISKGRSMCLSCGHELAVRDLIPVYSWLSLRGKCRYCNVAIPDTPIAELLVPISFVLSYLWWPLALHSGLQISLFVIWLAALVAFVALILYDLRWYLLPDRIVFPLIGLSIIWRLLLIMQAGSGWMSTLLAAVWGVSVLAGLFYALFQLSDGNWIGGGDVKLAIALGLFVGGPLAAILLLFAASTTGTLASLPAAVTKHSLRGTRIPFGPFLLIATVVVVLFGPIILDWYKGLFVT